MFIYKYYEENLYIYICRKYHQVHFSSKLLQENCYRKCLDNQFLLFYNLCRYSSQLLCSEVGEGKAGYSFEVIIIQWLYRFLYLHYIFIYRIIRKLKESSLQKICQSVFSSIFSGEKFLII